jgi:hypothetical protein
MMRIDFQFACHVYNNIHRLPKLKRHPTFRIPNVGDSVRGWPILDPQDTHPWTGYTASVCEGR